jgi:hypothetical protein
MRQWQPPFVAQLDIDADEPPAIFVRHAGELIVSRHLMDAIMKNCCLGIHDFNSITITSTNWNQHKTSLLPEYFHANVKPLEYDIDITRSAIKASRLQKCSHCLGGEFHPGNRIALSDERWRQLDIFVVDAIPGTTIISSRFSELIRSNAGYNYVLSLFGMIVGSD